jgi:hypothetical protein
MTMLVQSGKKKECTSTDGLILRGGRKLAANALLKCSRVARRKRSRCRRRSFQKSSQFRDGRSHQSLAKAKVRTTAMEGFGNEAQGNILPMLA